MSTRGRRSKNTVTQWTEAESHKFLNYLFSIVPESFDANDSLNQNSEFLSVSIPTAVERVFFQERARKGGCFRVDDEEDFGEDDWWRFEQRRIVIDAKWAECIW